MKYVLITKDNKEITLSQAIAYALETSRYIIPAPSTEEIWRYTSSPTVDEADVLYEISRLRMHKAYLCWDDEYGWTYIYE